MSINANIAINPLNKSGSKSNFQWITFSAKQDVRTNNIKNKNPIIKYDFLFNSLLIL